MQRRVIYVSRDAERERERERERENETRSSERASERGYKCIAVLILEYIL
jgi:hypothetical protein